MDAPTSAQELHGETHTTIMPPKESVDLTFIADETGSEADMHQPTFSVDEPAPEAAKHQPASSWTSLLWKKQS
jgi:hypothetical protein